jgi:hypothetical protein
LQLDRLERGLTVISDILILSLPIDEETKKMWRSRVREEPMNCSNNSSSINNNNSSSSSEHNLRKRVQFIESDSESDVRNKKIRLDGETDGSTNNQKNPVAVAVAATSTSTATATATATTAAALTSKDHFQENSCSSSTINISGYSPGGYSKQESVNVEPEQGCSHWQPVTSRTAAPISAQKRKMQQQHLVQQPQQQKLQQLQNQQNLARQRREKVIYNHQQRQQELQQLRLREQQLQEMLKQKRMLLQKKKESAAASEASASVTGTAGSDVTTLKTIPFQQHPQQQQQQKEMYDQRVRQAQQHHFQKTILQQQQQQQQLRREEEIIDLDKSSGKESIQVEAEQTDEMSSIEVGRTVTQFSANSTALEGEQFRASTPTYVNVSRRSMLRMSDINTAVKNSVEALNSTLSRKEMVKDNGDAEEKKKR